MARAARLVGIGGEIAIVLLFFLQGARVSRPAVLAGILHWRLHLIILAATFVVFPLLGLAMRPLSGTVLAPSLYVGLMFLCTLPSAVQSSVVFTAIAGGNVPAALCSASLSSVVGMVLTPLLVGLLLQAEGGPSLNGVGSIVTHMLLPFLAGQIVQRWLDGWLQRHRRVVGLVDRAAVLLMVYGLISAATLSGLWARTPAANLLVVALIDGALLAAMLALTALAARRFGFPREDEIAIVFCGSKKSPGHGNYHGQRAVLRRLARPGGPAVDDLSPDAVDGLRHARPALCSRPIGAREPGCKDGPLVTRRSALFAPHPVHARRVVEKASSREKATMPAATQA